MATDKLVGNASRNGFETAIVLGGKDIPLYAKAVALNKDDKIQGFTASIDIVSGRLYGESSSIWNSTSRESSEYGDQYEDPKDNGDDQKDASGQLSVPLGLVLSAIAAVLLGNGL